MTTDSSVSSVPYVPASTTLNLLALSAQAIQELVSAQGWPRYRAEQILQWLYRRRARTIDQMTDLGLADRNRLRTLAEIQRLHLDQVLTSSDGTRKFLFRLDDGLIVESVCIPDNSRLTLCLSTQVGCTLDCRFCLTGQMGLHRNLKAHEIVDQVLSVLDHFSADERLTNLVLMGMGEPLANLEAVTDAIHRLTNTRWGLGIAPRRLTLSTAGLANRLGAVAPLGVNLAVSLNATTRAQRDQVMPTANQLHPLDEVLAACRDYALPPRRHLTFEYVLLAGVNDSSADARRLVKLLSGIRSKINLIPFNEFPGSPYLRPADAVVLQFQAILKAAGFPVFIRQSKGPDILGACGQLGQLPASQASPPLVPVGSVGSGR
ncbi:MAG: 23S rRNA (adenine(2503)-C(2))-methyltransferase RlmN [Nitrospirales bacterium]